jgi:glycosyltransferase involved in cell wall biosynthesis
MANIRVAYLVTLPIQYQAPLLRRLAREPGIDLTVFFCTDYGAEKFLEPTYGRVIEWGIPLLEGYSYEVLPRLGGRERVSFLWPLNYGLAKRLREGRFEVLWIHGYNRWFHWLAILRAKAMGLKVLIRDDATLISAQRNIGKRLLKKGFFAVLKRLVDGFLVVGSLNREYYRHYGISDEKIFLVPYAVDNAFFQAETRKARTNRGQLRRELGLAEDRPVILYVSRLIARKHGADLLSAYIDLTRGAAAAPTYLLFVGDGDQRQALEEMARANELDSVRFPGFKNQTELPAYYDLCDVFVLPSVYEPWGMVVNEVMNAGRAIIVSDQVGCGPDLVRDGENGYIFPARDVAALSEALRKVLSDPEKCRSMGARSREIISQSSFDKDVEGLKLAIQTVMART